MYDVHTPKGSRWNSNGTIATGATLPGTSPLKPWKRLLEYGTPVLLAFQVIDGEL
jgi:hypothetical protein